jgi:Holliday junction resolvase RusA-like endonuclease
MFHLDLDNMIKFVLDALNKKAYLDDSQICSIKASKVYTIEESRTYVEINKLKLIVDKNIIVID